VKSLQSALHALSFDSLLARLFAITPWEEVAGLAGWIAASDPYGERQHVIRALELVSPGSDDARAYVEHQVWCAWRQAAWTSGLAEPLQIRVEGKEWISETADMPTLLVTPMTLAPADAMHAIAELNTTGRACVVFGEDLDVGATATRERLEIVTGMSSATVRRILEVLNGGGVLCTYPDFVYEGRTADWMPMFGTHRPVSSGFLSLAARDGTMLLPLICLRDGDAMAVHIEEPLRIRDEMTAATTNRDTARAIVAGAVGELLEGLIRRAPEQWLLLPTLTFESPEMAGVASTRDATSST
jgi:lauroyl/myristoyl acyltransferase